MTEPVHETDPAKARMFAWGQRSIVDRGTEVAGVNVGDHLAAVALRSQKLPGDLVERNRLGAGDFDGSVDRRRYRNVGQRSGDIFGGDGLEQGGRHANGVAVGPRLDDAAHELEELRGAQDGIGNAGLLDQLLLRQLGGEILALEQALGTDDRERDMMPDARSPLRRK